ncbi:hypothetical protein [Halochromatium sp.]
MPGVSELHSVSRQQSTPEPTALQRLLADRADLWRGRVETSALAKGMATGFAELDQALPWDGWPINGLTEVLTDQPGAGLALILPALARLCSDGRHSPSSQADQSVAQPGRASREGSREASRGASRDQAHLHQQDQGWLLLVSPPLIPYAPALVAQGLDLERLLLVDAPAQGAWVMEQGLRMGGCAAVIAWTASEPGHQGRKQDAAWTTPVLRRLQLAAQSRSTPVLLLRPTAAAEYPTPAMLRLDCEAGADGLLIGLRKLRGGRAGRRLSLSASSLDDLGARPPSPSTAAPQVAVSCS